jgi:hypothetical protein
MKTLARLGFAVTIAAAAAGVFVAPASAATGQAAAAGGAGHVVFVQTDNTAGNQIVAYDRSSDGRLTLSGTYATGGLGGILDGSVVDHLASQGSLTYDRLHGLLYGNGQAATCWVTPVRGLLLTGNAGSATVSSYSSSGGKLTLLGATVTDPGTVDSAASPDGRFLYVQTARAVPVPGARRADQGDCVQAFRIEGQARLGLPGRRGPQAFRLVRRPGRPAHRRIGIRAAGSLRCPGSTARFSGAVPSSTPRSSFRTSCTPPTSRSSTTSSGPASGCSPGRRLQRPGRPPARVLPNDLDGGRHHHRPRPERSGRRQASRGSRGRSHRALPESGPGRGPGRFRRRQRPAPMSIVAVL